MNKNKRLSRAITCEKMLKLKDDTLTLSDKWRAAFGSPERAGMWFVWGNSGNGKSSFAALLAAELSNYGKVLYDSLEEGTSLTIRNTFKRYVGKNRKIKIVREPMSDLSLRLQRKRSAEFVIIDSFQYTDLNFAKYLIFKERHKNKLIVFVSQADGNFPVGRPAKSAMFDAALKIWVEGYKAFSKGRFIGENGGVFTIWEQGADRYWNKNNNNLNQ